MSRRTERLGFNRRSFLKGVGGVVGASTLAGPWLQFPAFAQDSLTIAQGADATTLDPKDRGSTATGNVILAVFDPLLVRDADMSIKSWLAKSVAQKDETTWVVNLEEGISFSNGEPLNAEAIKYSLDRILDPEKQAVIKRFFDGITGSTVIDEYTLEIDTEIPNDTLFHIRMTFLFPVPPQHVENVGDEAFSQSPLGTGPYEFVEWIKDDRIELRAQPDYWAGTMAYEQVTFTVIPEDLSRIAALRTGEVDVAVGIPPAQAEALEGREGLFVAGGDTPTTRVMVLTFDTSEPPADSLDFRKAVKYAVHPQPIIQGLFSGRAVPVNSSLSPGVPGWPQETDYTYPYDPDQAQALLDGLDLGNEEILLRTPRGTFPQDAETAQAVAGQLQEVGINAAVRAEEYGGFFDDLTAGEMSPLFLMGQGNVWLDPVPQLDAFYASEGFISTFADDQVDQYLQQASKETNAEERSRIIGQTLQRLKEQAAGVPLFAQVFLYGVNDRVQWTPRPDVVVRVHEFGRK